MKLHHLICIISFILLSGCVFNQRRIKRDFVLKPGDFWVEDFFSGSFPSKAFTNDKIYCSSINISNGLPNYLYCFDLKTGKVDWRYPVERHASNPPIVLDSMIYFSTYTGDLHCVTLDGKRKWVRNSRGPFSGHGFNPKNNNLFVATTAGGVYEYDATTGENVDTLGYNSMGTTLPVVLGNFKIAAQFMPEGYKEESAVVCESNDGREIWRKSFGQVMDLYFSNGRIFFQDDKQFWCLEASSGKILWAQPNPRNWEEKVGFEGNAVFLSKASDIKVFDVVTGNKINRSTPFKIRTYKITEGKRKFVVSATVDFFSPLNGCELTVEEM